MGKDTVISVILRLRDEMGGQAKKALDGLAQAAKGAGASAKALDALDRATRTTTQGAGAAAKAMDTLGRSATQGAGQAARAVGRIGQNAAQAAAPVRAVGQAVNAFRSERVLAAARHAAQLAKEARAARRAVDDTAKAAGRLEGAMTRAGGAGRTAASVMRGVGQVGAGLAAGAGVAGAALRQPIAFEKRMTLMANTAYADEKDPAKRLAGRKGLVKAVHAAVREGGGTRDEAAEALDKMLASGAIKADAAQKLLPTIQKFASASGTQSGDIADIVIRGVQNKFFSEDQAGQALDKALTAGQAGGFELKDMAKWLPKMMAMGSGMKGMAGFEQILAYSQAAATTAGGKDEAGNNLVNLLQKLNSQDTQKDFAKLGVDLTGTLTKARSKGVLPLEAFGDLVDKQVMGKDKRYTALRKRLDTAQGDEKKQILNDMTDLASASAIGKVVQDRQALLALLAAITQKDYIKDIQGKMANAQGEGDRSFATYKASTAYSVERAANEAEIARSGMLADTSGPLKAVADTAADLAQKFPVLATTVAEVTTAAGTLSSVLLAAGGARMLLGGGGGGLLRGAGGLLKGAPGLLGRFAGPLAAVGLAGLDIYSVEANPALSRAQKNISHAENAGGLAAAIAGMKMGAMAGGTIGAGFAGVGAAPGALLGGLAGGALGWWSGSMAGRQMGHWMFGPSQETMDQAKKIVVEDRGVIKVESVLHLDGREVAKVVNDYNAADAKRH
ncbi:phage tail tape measure protein [Fundidesulfovibrio butyratiphilus]